MLQEHTKQLEAKHEQVLQLKIKHILLEKDKESKEVWGHWFVLGK